MFTKFNANVSHAPLVTDHLPSNLDGLFFGIAQSNDGDEQKTQQSPHFLVEYKSEMLKVNFIVLLGAKSGSSFG